MAFRALDRFQHPNDCATVLCTTCICRKYPLTLRLADQTRSDFAAIESDLQFIMAQLARIPTRKEQARNALGIIFATAMLTTLAVLWFTGYWRYCL
jgi:hypothetical protein